MKVFTYDQLERNGRLGNQLWEVASTIGLAAQHGGVARFRPDWEYRPYFSLPDELFEPVPPGVEVEDGGLDYLQDLAHFAGVQDQVRSYLAPCEESRAHLEAHYARYLELPDTCALCVRRTSYLEPPECEVFSWLTDRYWETAMDLVGRDSSFLIFSDDLDWCRRRFGTAPNLHYVEGAPRPLLPEDRIGLPQDQWTLFLMARCERHIIANSTYSWWGAYLSDDPSPIYPDRWFEGILADEPVERMIPPTWQQVGC